MKKRLAVATLGAVVLAAVAFSASASAAVDLNQRFTDNVFVATCTGEIVAVTADFHLVSRVEVDGNGVSHLGSTTTAFFSGVTSSGLRLVSPSHQTNQILGDLDDEQNQTSTFEWNLILQGEGANSGIDDIHEQAIFHFTFDANGELTSSKSDFVAVCT